MRKSGSTHIGHGQVAAIDLAVDLADGVEDAGIVAVQAPQDAAAPAHARPWWHHASVHPHRGNVSTLRHLRGSCCSRWELRQSSHLDDSCCSSSGWAPVAAVVPAAAPPLPPAVPAAAMGRTSLLVFLALPGSSLEAPAAEGLRALPGSSLLSLPAPWTSCLSPSWRPPAPGDTPGARCVLIHATSARSCFCRGSLLETKPGSKECRG